MDWITGPDFYASTLRFATPLLLAALGGMFSERSGVLNLALEGMMLMGAFSGYIAALYSGSVWLGVLAALLSGGILALLHAFMSIQLRVNQIVSALGLNMLALGLTSSLYRMLFGRDLAQKSSPGFGAVHLGPLSEIPFLGEALFRHTLLVYLAFALVPLCGFLLYRTQWGLAVRAVGEHPRAVDTLGLNVYSLRYVAVLISGLLAGLGGAAITITGLNNFYDNITVGRGFIAFAAIVFGKWSPLGIMIACLLFGAGEALQLRLQVSGVPVPHHLLFILPYALTFAALVLFMGPSRGPAAAGLPYVREGK